MLFLSFFLSLQDLGKRSGSVERVLNKTRGPTEKKTTTLELGERKQLPKLQKEGGLCVCSTCDDLSWACAGEAAQGECIRESEGGNPGEGVVSTYRRVYKSNLKKKKLPMNGERERGWRG